MCKGFPGSVLNDLYKTMFLVSLSYHSMSSVSLGDPNEHAEGFPVSVMNALYKTIF